MPENGTPRRRKMETPECYSLAPCARWLDQYAWVILRTRVGKNILPNEGGLPRTGRRFTVRGLRSVPANGCTALRACVGVAVLWISVSSSAVANAAEAISLPAVAVEGDRLERERGLVPESHAVLGRAVLEGEVAADGFALLDRVANTSVGFARNTPFSIRGVGNDSVTPGLLGRVAHVAGVHFDNVAATPTYVDFFTPTLWDVDTVSVFRGPISTSHGVNALIGGVFLHYAAPDFTAGGRARVRAAGDATYEAALMQNVPLIADRLALRVAVEHRESDGASRNVTRGVDDWTRFEQDHLRGLLRWQPAGDDSLRLDLLFRRERSDFPNGAMVRALPGGSFFDRVADADAATDANGSGDFAALTVQRRFSADTRLTAITAWQRLKTSNTFDLDFTARPLGFGDASQREHSISQDLQWRRAFSGLELLAGAYAEHARHHQRYATFLSIPGLPKTSTNSTRIDSDTAAVFGQALWRIGENWSVETGLRAHHEERAVAVDNRNDGFGLPTGGKQRGDVLSPRVSVTWEAQAGTHVGALVSHGFRGGGISSALLLAQTRAYEPEHAWNYEVFLRHTSRDASLWLQANAYCMDWRQQQVSATAAGGMPGLDDVVFNAGRSRLHGFEWEAGWRVASDWRVSVSLGHAATRFVRFVNGGADYAGQPFPNAPKWSGSLGVGYRVDAARPGFFGGGAFTWRDATYSLIGLREFSRLEARSLLSGRIGWRWRRGVSVYLEGENLLDDDFAYARIDRRVFGVSGPLGRASQPRTLGVGAEFAW
jgi:iron complex outermembrane receptor protein